ncbi:MAG: TetR/AcrR family transcriptional regulator [Sandaracinaceae bacterium]|nr:TetR/AcrR family transcriptional regulator [Sandaracinaceae bacterium]
MPRRRLKGPEARARILEAASQRLAEVGPEGLRLSALAQELGVSHQAILHHFGSREGLVAEVMKRAIDDLHRELAAGLMVLDDPAGGSRELIGRAFDVLVGQGYGKLLAHLALAQPAGDELDRRRPLQMLAQMAHLVRERSTEQRHDPRDTAFVLLLLAYVVLGASVFEEGVLRAAGLADDPRVRDEFRAWLAALVSAHVERPSQP